jgi:hypothetical protein
VILCDTAKQESWNRKMKYLNGILIKIYNLFISTKFINKNNKVCRRFRKMLFHNICHECYSCFGKLNPDKKLYLIRCPQETMGLFGVYNYVVEHLKKADSINAIPVIDWQYYPNSSLLYDDAVGKENAWEYYFEQPGGISVRECYHSKNVIMSNGNGMESLSETFQYDKLKESHRLIEKYIRLNSKVSEYVDNEYKRLEMKNSRVLGVLCRGTDFIHEKPKGHAICPTVEETILKIEEKQEEWVKYDKIFLATEDEYIFNVMKKYYGDSLIYCQEHRVKNTQGKWLNELYDDKKYKGKREQMQEYLASIYLLAKCDAIIAPNVGGTLGAMRIKGKYDNSYIFQLGIYR